MNFTELVIISFIVSILLLFVAECRIDRYSNKRKFKKEK